MENNPSSTGFPDHHAAPNNSSMNCDPAFHSLSTRRMHGNKDYLRDITEGGYNAHSTWQPLI